MKKRIVTVIAAALALFTLTAAPAATAGDLVFCLGKRRARATRRR
jgi:hypothetical protein